jgi:hypothetical protein
MENKSPNKILRAVEAVEAMEDRGWDEKEDRGRKQSHGDRMSKCRWWLSTGES